MPTIIKNEDIITVERKTKITIVNSLPNFSVRSKLAIDDEIVKNINGIIAVNNKFKKISPIGFNISTSLPKINPSKLPAKIPPSNKIILL